MKKYIIIITLLVVSKLITAQAYQDVSFSKDNFEDSKGLKQAQEHINYGDYHFFTLDKFEFLQAMLQYEKAYEFNPYNSELNFKLGTCYIYNNKVEKGLKLIEESIEINDNVHELKYYYLGQAHHFSSHWDDAIYYYKKHDKELDAGRAKYGDVTKFIEECRNGKDLESSRLRITVENLGEKINTEYQEYSARINADQTMIVYTARRNTTTGGETDDYQDEMYYEDIVFSYKENGKWIQSKEGSEPLNTNEHDAPAGLSSDGKKMIVYRGNEMDLYLSEFVNGEWTKPEPLDAINSKKGRESSACFSYDGNKIYFISDRDGGYGNGDLWQSIWDDEKEDWGEPTNMGPVLNTKYEEKGVYLHPNGKTLYFSSQGHKTIGGLDIFKSELDENGNWGPPVNIKMPINTPMDDVFYIVAANGVDAYYSSRRDDSFGEMDIYKLRIEGVARTPLLSSENPLLTSYTKPFENDEDQVEVGVFEREKLAILKGKIRDEETKEFLEAELELVDLDNNEVIGVFNSDGISGAFMVALPAGVNYGIAVRKKGYLFHSENFNMPDTSSYIEVNKDVDLKKLKVGSSIVLKNIFYDLDKYTLRPESKNELDRLIKLMEDNESLKIELSGHTDTRGDYNYNKQLSENRVKSVVDYLVEHGINEDRLLYVGHGEDKTIISDEEIGFLHHSKREDAHQSNRRTEIKILEIN